jgi:exopolysaccharide biosynthesis polyprenyl glycosylphosphotransferase
MARKGFRASYFRRTAGALLACDALNAIASVFIACKFRFLAGEPWDFSPLFLDEDLRPYVAFAVIAPFVRVATSFLAGVYRIERKPYWLAETLPRLIGAVTLGTAVYVLLAFFGVLEFTQLTQYRTFTYSRVFFLYEGLVNLVLVIGAHTLARIVRAELGRQGLAVRRIAVQGSGVHAKALAAESDRLREAGYTFAGCIAIRQPAAKESGGDPIPYLGSPNDILSVINAHNLNEIVVTEPAELGQSFLEFCDACHKLDVIVKLVPDLYGLLFQGQPVDAMAGVPVIQVNDVAITGFRRWVKRGEDLAVGSALLFLLSPLLMAVAIAIRLDTPGPVLFRQVRLGKNGRALRMFKFRSMYRDAEERRQELGAHNVSDGPLFKLKDDPRVTRVGRFIRKTSIDELPQLINVIRGEMSLVGPRPLPVTDISNPNEWEARRFAATPGMTGLWQVNRTEHTSEEMLRWDLYYIENWSLWLDFRILLKTIFVVLTRRGAY